MNKINDATSTAIPSSNSNVNAKKIISVMISFILAIVLTLLTVMVSVYFGFLNTKNIIVSFNKVDYYSNVLDHFNEKAWDTTIPLGLPQEVVTSLVDINKVSTDVKGNLTAGLDQTDYTADSSEIEIRLEEQVRTHFANQGIVIDTNQETVLAEYKEIIGQEYLKSVEIPVIKYFGNAKNLYQKVMMMGIPICLILSCIAAIMLLKLQKWKHRGLRYITYSTLAAMLMSAIVPTIILIGGIYKKLNLSPEYFYDFVIKYLEGGLQTFLYFAIVWFVISAILLFVIRTMKQKLKIQSKNRSR